MWIKGLLGVAAAVFGAWLIIVGIVVTNYNNKEYKNKQYAIRSSLLIVLGIIIFSIPFCIMATGV